MAAVHPTAQPAGGLRGLADVPGLAPAAAGASPAPASTARTTVQPPSLARTEHAAVIEAQWIASNGSIQARINRTRESPLVGITLVGSGAAPIVVSVEERGCAHGVIFAGDRITHVAETEIDGGEQQVMSLLQPLFGHIHLRLRREGAHLGEPLALVLPPQLNEVAGSVLAEIDFGYAKPVGAIMIMPADPPLPRSQPDTKWGTTLMDDDCDCWWTYHCGFNDPCGDPCFLNLCNTVCLASFFCSPCTLSQLWHHVTRRRPSFIFAAGVAMFCLAVLSFVLLANGVSGVVALPLLFVAILGHCALAYGVNVSARRDLRRRYRIAPIKDQTQMSISPEYEDEFISLLCQPCSVFQCLHFLGITPARYRLLSPTGTGQSLAQRV